MERLPIKIKKGAAIVMAALAINACGEPLNEEVPATVIEKSYDDPDSWIQFVMVGKVLVPMSRHDPEHYYLGVEQCLDHDSSGSIDTEECNTYDVEVDPQTYNEIPVGSSVTVFDNQVQQIPR